jgi:hypothetical protein
MLGNFRAFYAETGRYMQPLYRPLLLYDNELKKVKIM